MSVSVVARGGGIGYKRIYGWQGKMNGINTKLMEKISWTVN